MSALNWMLYFLFEVIISEWKLFFFYQLKKMQLEPRFSWDEFSMQHLRIRSIQNSVVLTVMIQYFVQEILLRLEEA